MAELVVIGAGPAGVRAAATLAKAGRRVVLIDENLRIGGQIYRQPPPGAERPAEALYGFEAAKAVAIHQALDGLGDRIDYRPETLVWNVRGRVLDLTGPRGAERLEFDRLVLATGATDRSIPFPGWTLPGVFSLGGAQIALKAQGCAIGRRVVFAGTGPLLPLVAYQYAKAGATVAAVLDTSSFANKLKAAPGLLNLPKVFAKGLYYLAELKRRGVPVIDGVEGFAVEGAARPEAITWRRGGETRRIACDAVGAGFGLRSETQLADLLGCAFAFDDLTRQWLPVKDADGRASERHIYLAGDGAGIAGADAAELAGERVALTMLGDLGAAVDGGRVAVLDRGLARIQRFRRAIEAAFPFPHHFHAAIPDDLTICRCEGVSAGDLRRNVEVREAREMNRLKAYSRLGMGRCQGRMCASAGAELLSHWRGIELEAVGRLRGQAPVKPIPVAASSPEEAA
ncbi:FAD/NAD(P)-binding oxidoreductase [Aliidongia dinghuensis]|uniref:FAD/NAD(P)-binding oxidoreductase n=1 Tax=Aliidongia dinghuensis TaxID=1867774 RepID=A0A8J2YV64_9PROT|nr:NAD(P)/FAD-dependent oxidoreductase [Aliidongia dinghuensis]GGF26722.1 FAD/NAD(P)-binding oxidoreductase [Aliidongia dinghuensis]